MEKKLSLHALTKALGGMKSPSGLTYEVVRLEGNAAIARSFKSRERRMLLGLANAIDPVLSNPDALRKDYQAILKEENELEQVELENNPPVAWFHTVMKKVGEFCQERGIDPSSQEYLHLRLGCRAVYDTLTDPERLKGETPDYVLDDADFEKIIATIKLQEGEPSVAVISKCAGEYYGRRWFKAAVWLITEASPAEEN